MTDRGAHYHRCDFQVHTPRDNQWDGPRATTDPERVSYANEFVAACRERSLGAVAITDHHDFVIVPFIRAAAAAELDPNGAPIPAVDKLTVFPGLELTLGVPCQAVLIFDADFPNDRMGDILVTLGAEQYNPDAPSLPNVTRLDHINSLKQLHELLDQRDWLKGRYIVLPNVTDGGHGTLMRTGMQSKYKEMPCVGGYLDGTVDKIGIGNERIFAGLDVHWGSKRIAVVQTSDSRSSKFSDLGKNTTWIKWATPTAEALRQACLAPESRISQVQPQLPSVYVSRLSVSNSRFMGPVDLDLSCQFNAIVGGRGTGKSTLLDYLRWALCDQPVSSSVDDELADPRTRREKLIESTLLPFESTVDVHFTINDIPHIVRRHAKTGEVHLKVGSNDFAKVRETDVRQLLSVHAYSQKQLSSVAVRVDELSRFVNAPILADLATFDREIGDLSARIRENYASLQRYRDLGRSIAQLELSLQSLTEQAQNLRSSLGAVSVEDRETLQAKPAYDAVETAVTAWDGAVERGIAAADRLVRSTEELIASLAVVPDGAPLGESVGKLRAEVLASLEQLHFASREAASSFQVATKQVVEPDGTRAIVGRGLSDYNDLYEAVKERSTAHSAKLQELADLEKRQQAVTRDLQAQRDEHRELGDPLMEHGTLREGLFELFAKRSTAIAKQCADLSALSDGLIRATLRRGQGLSAVQERFRGLVSGSGLRANKVEALFEALAAESDPLETWEGVLQELESMNTMEDPETITSQKFPLLGRLGMAPADLKRVMTKMSPDGWLNLALTSVADRPAFEYQVREGEFIDFSVASAGQQATALLTVLLSQSGAPLIIDQPEDDLDSQVVVEIVGRIWTAKARRQLIFSSHNANFVVNGDADLVVCCDYRTAGDQSGGRIKVQGAIDMPDVRGEITRVMEGGEKAFRLRKEKYGF